MNDKVTEVANETRRLHALAFADKSIQWGVTIRAEHLRLYLFMMAKLDRRWYRRAYLRLVTSVPGGVRLWLWWVTRGKDGPR